MTVEEMLDLLDEYKCALEVQRMDMAKLKDAAIPADVAAKLAEIDAEFAPAIEAGEAAIVELEGKIKAATLEAGATVKGKAFMAVWNKGRVSWDSKKLDGMMILVPQLKDARKEGEPTITIRKI